MKMDLLKRQRIDSYHHLTIKALWNSSIDESMDISTQSKSR